MNNSWAEAYTHTHFMYSVFKIKWENSRYSMICVRMFHFWMSLVMERKPLDWMIFKLCVTFCSMILISIYLVNCRLEEHMLLLLSTNHFVFSGVCVLFFVCLFIPVIWLSQYLVNYHLKYWRAKPLISWLMVCWFFYLGGGLIL